jgi:arylsulfatase A-like enzyme
MNLIVLCSDTFRVDHLSCYGASPVSTPNLDRLAAEGVRFTSAFGEGTPTLPARRVMYTGRRIFPFLWAPQKWDQVQLPGWHPLFYEDVTLAEWLHERGYGTGLVSDLPHQFKPGKNFHRGFRQFRWVRGQEFDYLTAGPRDDVPVDRFVPADAPPRAREVATQFLMNSRDWRGEADWASAQVLQQGIDFVRENARQTPFLLWLEAFSPHEPWYAPPGLADKYYRQLGGGDYQGIEWIFPPGTAAGMTPEQALRVRAHYAGLCEMIDRWFGRLREAVEGAGLLDDTILVFLSDHGTMMGEQGQYHKGPDRLRHQCTRVPLLIRHPDTARFGGRVVEGFVQHQDLMPTLLALLGAAIPERVTGRDLSGAMAGDALPDATEHVITTFGWYASVRTRAWNYQTPWVKPDWEHLPSRQSTLTAPQL